MLLFVLAAASLSVISGCGNNDAYPKSTRSESAYEATTNVLTGEGKTEEEISKIYSDCLLENAKYGDLSSGDGGKSALVLMGRCQPQWRIWINGCIARGRDDKNCTVDSGLLAQAALLFAGK